MLRSTHNIPFSSRTTCEGLTSTCPSVMLDKLQRGEATRVKRTLDWLARIAFAAVLLASPWPFGSVTPRPASLLAVTLVVLFAFTLSRQFLSGRVAVPPGWLFAILAFALFGLQLVPLPGGIVRTFAPAVADLCAPLVTELFINGWHPSSIEPFRTVWSVLLLVSLASGYYLASRFSRRARDREVLAAVVVLLGLALSLFAVYQRAKWGTVLYGRFPTPSATPFGPFVNHNHFAGFVEASALLALGTALGLARRHGSLALLFGGAAAMMGIAHVLSHSRGGFLAAGAGLVTLALLSYRREGKGQGIVLVSALAVSSFLLVFAPSGVFDRLSSIGNPEADDSVQFRLTLWSDSLGLAGGSPLIGTGLGTYASAIPGYRTGLDETRAEYAESDWLQLLCEAGAMGVLIAFGFLFAVIRRAHSEIRSQPSERLRGIGYGALAGIVALVIHGLYDFNLHIPSNVLLFAVLLGIAAPAGAFELRVPRLFRYVMVAVTLVLALTFTGLVLRLGRSQDLNRRIDPLFTEAEALDETIQTLSSSRERAPSNPDTWFLLGRLYNEEAFRAKDAARYREIRFEQSRDAFTRALELAPARGRFWFELAWVEGNLGNDVLADKMFTIALRLEPTRSNLRGNYALFLASRGRLDDALVQLEIGRKLRPGLHPLDALNVIGPYLGDDGPSLMNVVGDGPEAKRALATYRREQERQ
jgi:tetratricopeptide (TPR) repeat protein